MGGQTFTGSQSSLPVSTSLGRLFCMTPSMWGMSQRMRIFAQTWQRTQFWVPKKNMVVWSSLLCLTVKIRWWRSGLLCKNGEERFSSAMDAQHMQSVWLRKKQPPPRFVLTSLKLRSFFETTKSHKQSSRSMAGKLPSLEEPPGNEVCYNESMT